MRATVYIFGVNWVEFKTYTCTHFYFIAPSNESYTA